MIQLPDFLLAHSQRLKVEFQALSKGEKDTLLASHQEAKDEKENIPARASNAAISKLVNAKMECITNMVLCVYISALILF